MVKIDISLVEILNIIAHTYLNYEKVLAHQERKRKFKDIDILDQLILGILTLLGKHKGFTDQQTMDLVYFAEGITDLIQHFNSHTMN